MPQRAGSLEEKQQALFSRAEALHRTADTGRALPRGLARDLGRQLRLIALSQQSPEEALDVVPRGRQYDKPGAVKSTPFARHLRENILGGWGTMPESIRRDEQRPLIERLRRLDAYGRELEAASRARSCTVSPDVLRFLAWALARIAAGDDARAVLGVRAKRGERYNALAVERRDRLMLAWIAAASDPGGSAPMSRADAIKEAAKHFGVGITTVRKVWNFGSTHRGQDFSLTGDTPRP